MTQETRRDLRFPIFCAATVAGALVLTAYAWTSNKITLSAGDYQAFVLVLVAIVVSEYLAIALPGGPTVSLSYPLSVAALVLFGPAWGGLITAVSALPSLFGAERPGALRFVVNTAQTVLSAVFAGLAFLWLGGVPLVAGGTGNLLGMTPALIAAASVGILANAALLAMTYSLLQGRTFASIWTEIFAWSLPSQVVLGFAGVAMAAIIEAIGVWGSALFIVPLLVARQTYQQSIKLREAYGDTMSSLVAALEAKDLYTKGHSVRVAEYSVQIAQAMGFSVSHVNRIEQAALLHDLGKLGVSRRVLSKEARLTDGEYEEIKRHPDIGAHIVADVPYLADLVPWIAHHHERFDGRGYGDGTAGEAIPLEARILAVADSYDAMTSARPYRDAMSHEDAMAELLRNRGTQFDPQAVSAFERACVAAEDAATAKLQAVVSDES